MRWLLKFTDKLADGLIDVMPARVQLRVGIWLALISFPLYPYVFWSGEPPLIYLMSAAALTLTGIGIVLSAEVLEQTEETEEIVEQHCRGCACHSEGELPQEG